MSLRPKSISISRLTDCGFLAFGGEVGVDIDLATARMSSMPRSISMSRLGEVGAWKLGCVGRDAQYLGDCSCFAPCGEPEYAASHFSRVFAAKAREWRLLCEVPVEGGLVEAGFVCLGGVLGLEVSPAESLAGGVFGSGVKLDERGDFLVGGVRGVFALHA